LLKVHNNDYNDSVILGRNEYIGDLNGMHLILQSNCELQLKSNNKTIWSFAAFLENDKRCTLSVQENSIGISEMQGASYPYYVYNRMKILPPKSPPKQYHFSGRSVVHHPDLDQWV